MLRPAPPQTGNPDELSSYFLAPWCNRFADARFRFNCREYSLNFNCPDETAIHGDVRHRDFTILDRSPVSARLEYDARSAADRNWPWPYRVLARYELDDATLSSELEITNLSNEPVPVGLGFHPFWQRRLWDDRDDVCVQASLVARYPLANLLPTGSAVPDPLCDPIRNGSPVGSQALDDVFLGSLDGATLHWPTSGVVARFSCSPELSHAVLYVPHNTRGGPLSWFCLEPVSQVNDAFNLMARGVETTGTRVLQPQGSFRAKWVVRFEVGQIP